MRRIKVLAVTAAAALALAGCGNDADEKGSNGDRSEESGSGDEKPAGGDRGESSGGGDQPAGDDQAFVDEMADAIAAQADAEGAFPEDQLNCWVGSMVDGIGVDKMKEAGFTPESLASNSSEADLGALSDDERKVVADSFAKCIDLEEVFLAQIEADGGDEIPQEVKDCLAEIDWDEIEKVMGEAILANDEELSNGDEVMAPLMECMFGAFGDLGDLDTSAGTTTG